MEDTILQWSQTSWKNKSPMGQIAHMNISSCIISIPVLVLGNGFKIFKHYLRMLTYGNLENWSIVACLNMFPNNSMLTFKPPLGPQYWHLRVIRSAKGSWGAEWTENRWLAKMQYWSTDHSFLKFRNLTIYTFLYWKY